MISKMIKLVLFVILISKVSFVNYLIKLEKYLDVHKIQIQGQDQDQSKSEENIDNNFQNENLLSYLRNHHKNGVNAGSFEEGNLISENSNHHENEKNYKLVKLIHRLMLLNSLISDERLAKRSNQNPTEYKGKRLNNKNLFASGLQGVWGVPGK